MEYDIVHQSLIPMGIMSESLIVLRRDPVSGKCETAAPLQWNPVDATGSFKIEDGSFIISPGGFGVGSGAITTDIREFLQAMTDAAWKLGIKPAAAVDSASELKAVRYHLEDMRTIATNRAPIVDLKKETP